MKTKTCFKCKKIKHLSKFYKHPAMKDGHVNKCISCNKKDVHTYYTKKAKDLDWVEKERIRNREKYHRIYASQKPICAHPEVVGMWRKHPLPKGKEYHHWNYNLIKSVFILDRLNGHKRLHQRLIYDPKSNCFFNTEGEFLDTKEKHEQLLKELGIKYESVEL